MTTMTSNTATLELNEGNRCWICLGEGDELPPMGTPSDAHDWIKPCSCSLIAHKKCLINWILSMDLNKRRTLIQEAPLPAQQQPQQISVTVLNMIGINIRTEGMSQRLIFPMPFEHGDVTLCVKCPQCSNSLFLKNQTSRFNSVIQYLTKMMNSGTKFIFYSTLISTSIASTIASACATLSGIGLQIMNTLCPESVQMRLLNIPARSLVDLLNRNLLTGRFFTLTMSLPIYLISLRTSPYNTGSLQELFIQIFPLLFLDKFELLNTENSRAKLLIFSLNFSRFAYNLIFQLTLNRIYYKWVRLCQPSFIANTLSLEELDLIQRENEEEYEIKLEDEIENAKLNGKRSIYQKVIHYFTMSNKLKLVKRSRRRREFENCLKFDYSIVFNKSSTFITFGTTMLWPIFGERLSTLLLSRSQTVINFINKYARTPDELTFLRNILGCCCIVILKDLINLYLAWRKLQQINNLKIVEFGTDEWTRDSISALAEGI